MKTTHLLFILFVAFVANTACAQGKKDKEKYVFKSTKYRNTVEPENGLPFISEACNDAITQDFRSTNKNPHKHYPYYSDYMWLENDENLRAYLQFFEKKVRAEYKEGCNLNNRLVFPGHDKIGAITIFLYANAKGGINAVSVSAAQCLQVTKEELFAFKDLLLHEKKGELKPKFVKNLKGLNESKTVVIQAYFGIMGLIDLYDGASVKEVMKKHKDLYYARKLVRERRNSLDASAPKEE